jgi:hypothetical protein
MHANPSRPVTAALALAAGLMAACGGASEADAPEMAIAFAREELLSEATILLIYYFDDTMTCEDIENAMPRPTPTLGPFMATLDNTGRTRGITFTLNEVPQGAYLIFIEAQNELGVPVGTGCAPRQIVRDRQLSRIRIVVS